MIIRLIIVLLIFYSASSKAQSFQNGSFEKTTADSCKINISNSQFALYLNGVNGFGLQESLDIINNNYCSYTNNLTAQNGQWLIGLDVFLSPVESCAFSMELTAPLIMGSNYTITYYDAAASFTTAKILIGHSTNDSTFGDTLFISPLPIANTWSQRKFSFNAPNNGRYITVQAEQGGYQQWTLVDNFSINLTTIGLFENIQSSEIELFPNPATHLLTVELVKKSNFQLSIMNQQGTVIYHKKKYSDISHLDISNFPSGIYFCRIQSDNNKSFIKKFIKN